LSLYAPTQPMEPTHSAALPWSGIHSYPSDWQMSFAESHSNSLIRQCTVQAGLGGTTISFSILWEGKILSFGRSGPSLVLGSE
jgi:hypothetical protein